MGEHQETGALTRSFTVSEPTHLWPCEYVHSEGSRSVIAISSHEAITHDHYHIKFPVRRGQYTYVLQRVAIDEDKIRIVPWLNFAQFVGMQHDLAT